MHEMFLCKVLVSVLTTISLCFLFYLSKNYLSCCISRMSILQLYIAICSFIPSHDAKTEMEKLQVFYQIMKLKFKVLE